MSVILLLVIAVYIKGVDVCNIKMCLTWTVQKDHLDLTCKVNFLKYHVEFYNNYETEQGYCLFPKPSPKCITMYTNTVIRQNATTNVTYLKILDHIDSHFNGKWECRHGTNRDNAFVNITVLQADHKITEPKDGTCWQSYLAHTILGFGFTILTVAIIYIISLWCCYKDKLCRPDKTDVCNRCDKWFNQTKDNCCKSYKEGTCNGSDKRYNQTIESVQIGVFMILFITLLMIPVVKGLQDDNICRGEELYLILGSLLPFICVIPTLRLTKAKQSADDENGTEPPKTNGTD